MPSKNTVLVNVQVWLPPAGSSVGPQPDADCSTPLCVISSEAEQVAGPSVVSTVATSVSPVTFTVTAAPTNGQLELTGNPGVSINSFTQAHINASEVVYVHDGGNTTTDSFGGAETEILLPQPGTPAIVRPVMMRLQTEWVRTELPLFTKKERKAAPAKTGTVHRGPIPQDPASPDAASPAEIWTWVCPSNEQIPGKAMRYLVRDDEPVLGFEQHGEPPVRSDGILVQETAGKIE